MCRFTGPECSDMAEESNNLGALSAADKHRRAIAALEAELAMTEGHAKKLSATLARLTDPSQRDEMTALLKEESERAEQLRQQLRLLRAPA